MPTYGRLVDILLDQVKEAKNLPFTFRTAKCPSRNKTCRKRHNDVKIISYNEQTQLFSTNFYDLHKPDVVFQSEQSIQNIRKHIEKAIKKKLYDKEKLIKITKSPNRPKIMLFRVSNEEKKRISNLAKKHDLTPSDYLRKKIFG